ncbi:isochorismate synthase MenF [Bacillus sp. E214]|uniref:isochorismate synthase n=1 Tax=Bacillus sp. E214 TaxID=2587156 RepID=UPI0011DF1676|nr:isochorismate synthase [Bacillus sp. E214]
MAIKQMTDIQQGLTEALHTVKRIAMPILFSHVEAVTNKKPIDIYQSSECLYKGERFYWKDPDNELYLAGIGKAHKIQSLTNGEKRFKDIKEEWAALMESAIVNGVNSGKGTGPLCFGGFSFNSKNTEPGSNWSQFGSYLFYIPKFLITETNHGSYLTSSIYLTPHMSDKEVRQFIEDRDAFLSMSDSGQKEMPAIIERQEHIVEEWKQAILKSVEDIRNGQMEKIVLARELSLQFEDEVPSYKVLENLMIQQNGSFIFGLESGDDCFIGASPERLIKKEGPAVFSACLAGSTPRNEDEEIDFALGNELLNDDKNRSEHQFVVNMIKEAMEEHCIEINIPDAPVLMKLKNIQHLYTPVNCVSLPGTSVLDFVELLHPTPALGGSPRNIAMEKIEKYEGMDRGFYAAPIGWIDIYGNGDFSVGIRSGLLKKDKASLYAGCGIVEKSNPESEYMETKVKFKPMLSALEGRNI